MFEGTAITVLLAAAGGAVAGNLLSFLAKRVDNFVRKTETKLDDELWEAVRGGIASALGEFEIEVLTPVDETLEVWTDEEKKAEDLSSGH